MINRDYEQQYNTPLSDGETGLYEAWLRTLPEEQRNTYDYDLRGFAKSVNFLPVPKGHMPDTYKKPNHPTFQIDSQYNGVDGKYGGLWTNLNNEWTFYPSLWNEQFLDGYDDPTTKIVRYHG